MRDYDITGFVTFPFNEFNLKPINCGRTEVYLIAFDNNSKTNLPKFEGNLCGDDMSSIKSYNTSMLNIEEVISHMNNDDKEDSIYLKNDFKISSCVLLGWSKYSYIFSDRIEPWVCSFKDLTTEGRKLYYSLKKLHNNSELRILTFNKIK